MQTTSRPEEHEITALTLATQNAKRGDYEQAIVQLKKILDADPQHEIAAGMLAGIYAELGLHERAIESFRQVLAINSKNPLARFQLGLALLTVKRPQEALDTWKSGPNEGGDFLVQYYSALALLQLGQLAEARAMFKQAERTMPRHHALYPELREKLNNLANNDPH